MADTNALQDITHYSDSELSDIVFNDESLYNMRHNVDGLMGHIQESFLFNDDQRQELIQDLKDE